MNSSVTPNYTDPSPSISPEVLRQVYRKVSIGLTLGGLLYFMLMFPFGAILLKYRTNYVPKESDMDGEREHGEYRQRAWPNVNSYLGTFHRVLRVENWSGVYKGIMPSLIGRITMSCAVLITVLNRDPEGIFPERSIRYQLLNKFFMISITLPATIIINRAITTQSNLPWFGLGHSLRVLLTEEERRRPWLLYFTPGLFVTECSFTAYGFVLNWIIPAKLFVRDASDTSVVDPWGKIGRFCALLTYSLLTTTVECLYNNVFARLSVQRNQSVSSPASHKKSPQERETNLDCAYDGLFDCVRRMVDKEGYSALLRAWWYDFIPKLWWLPFIR